MTDFGSDFFCLEDFDAKLRFTSGAEIVRQHAFHRLTTDSLVDAEGWGFDCRRIVAREYSADTIHEVEPELEEVVLRDERVYSVTVRATLVEKGDPNEQDIEIAVDGESALGPFAFVMRVNAVTVEILNGEEPAT